MSSTAAPKAIDEGARAEFVALVRTVLATLVLTAIFVTLTPFQASFEGNADAGNLVNQLGYTALAGVAILGHLAFTERRVALSLLRPAWILTLLWIFFSTAQSLDPGNAARALAFTLFAMVAATGALCLPPNVRAFRFALGAAACIAVALSYFGIAFMPAAAIHSDAGPEGMHVGLWRGIYSHKNVAGAVMASFFFIGIYLMRARQWLVGGALTALSLIFVLQTGSKTAAALLPAVVILVMGGRLVGGRIVPVLVLSLALIVTALATLGSVMVPAINDVLQLVMPGTTFTGRTDLWRFALSAADGHLWTGFGFESFWRDGFVTTVEASRELAWDPRGATNAHNGYLDIAIATGWPGLALVVLILAVLPFADFLRSGRDDESRRLADLFLMILAFGLLNAFLESFLFERANPIWVTLWMAVVGLRLQARHGVDSTSS